MVGVDPATLGNWSRFGYLDALDAEQAKGRRWRRFSFFEIIRLAVLARLVEFGVPVGRGDKIARAVEAVVSAPDYPIDAPTFAVIKQDGISFVPAKEHIYVEPDDPLALVIPLRPLIRSVSAALDDRAGA